MKVENLLLLLMHKKWHPIFHAGVLRRIAFLSHTLSLHLNHDAA